MVRFKNRYLIVELLRPSASTIQLDQSSARPLVPAEDEQVGVDDNEDEEDEEGLPRIPELPFLLSPIPDAASLKDNDDTGKAFYRAVRDTVQDVFGDEGWGRVSSSFRVLYHSPLTTITLVRVARPHVRTLHAAVTLLSSVEGTPVLPRVIGVSGTVKKAQSRVMVYHRAMIAHMLTRFDEGVSRNREKDQVEQKAKAEEDTINSLND